MLRIILAIFAGVLLWGILWVGFHAVLVAAMPGSFDDLGITESSGLLIVFLAISVVLSTLAGWTTARLACRDSLQQPAPSCAYSRCVPLRERGDELVALREPSDDVGRSGRM